MPAEVRLFTCLSDNYGVLVHDPETGATASIDAPEAAPIEAALKATGWKLTDILVTHHHHDHTGGIQALKDKHKCRVVAPAKRQGTIPGVDETVREGDTVSVGKLSANVIETPGHTLGHIAYWFHAGQACFRRRHAVLHRLRAGDRGHAGDDVALAQEAARPARRHGNLLRPRIHRRQYPIRPHRRAGQSGAGGARGAGPTADRARRADHSGHRSATRNWPIRSCAPTCRRWPPAIGMAGNRRRRSLPKSASARTSSDECRCPRLPPKTSSACSSLKPHPEGGHYRETFRDSG